MKERVKLMIFLQNEGLFCQDCKLIITSSVRFGLCLGKYKVLNYTVPEKEDIFDDKLLKPGEDFSGFLIEPPKEWFGKDTSWSPGIFKAPSVGGSSVTEGYS